MKGSPHLGLLAAMFPETNFTSGGQNTYCNPVEKPLVTRPDTRSLPVQIPSRLDFWIDTGSRPLPFRKIDCRLHGQPPAIRQVLVGVSCDVGRDDDVIELQNGIVPIGRFRIENVK